MLSFCLRGARRYVEQGGLGFGVEVGVGIGVGIGIGVEVGG